MASAKKQIQQLARELFQLSLSNGEVSLERVSGVLEFIEAHRPSNSLAVLKSYYRLIAAETARGQAVVEHAGSVSAPVLAQISSVMTARYRRKIAVISRPNDSLVAGIRVRVGDDLYESSVASQLAQLAGTV